MTYEKLDTPQILNYIYYPRRDTTRPPEGCEMVSIMVDEPGQVSIACRFYSREKDWPLLIYFHGNGEVAADYDDIASIYLARRINLLVADFRGYGGSGGNPTIVSQLHDAPVVYDRAREIFQEKGFTGPVFVMGRSMGSLSGLEIAARQPSSLTGLILESGFCCITRLIKLFGIPADRDAMEHLETAAIANLGRISLPVLVIHGEYDSLVPIEEGELIYDHISSPDKKMVVIPRAGHNDIMFMDMPRYFKSIEEFIHGQ